MNAHWILRPFPDQSTDYSCFNWEFVISLVVAVCHPRFVDPGTSSSRVPFNCKGIVCPCLRGVQALFKDRLLPLLLVRACLSSCLHQAFLPAPTLSPSPSPLRQESSNHAGRSGSLSVHHQRCQPHRSSSHLESLPDLRLCVFRWHLLRL